MQDRKLPPGGGNVIWVLWITYGAFYFCRTNISATVPSLERDLGLSKEQIGQILGALKLAYGFGQFINGQLAERVSPRILLAVGMVTSAALNVAFGLAEGFYFLLFIWALNGYFQSLGWTPCMRVAGNWFSPVQRGFAIGVIGTGYQATAAVTYLVSTQAVEHFGWRFALYIPAAMLFAASVHMLLFLKEGRHSPQGGLHPATSARGRPPIAKTVMATLTNPSLWIFAVALGLLNACRYGFLDWGIAHLHEVREESVGKAGIKYMLLPLGGILGAFLSGWVSDRMFAGRRAPVICLLLLSLGALTLWYRVAVTMGDAATIITLVFIGFTIYGPQVLLVGTAPVDFARDGAGAAAVGFVNCMGYMGAYAGDAVTGILTANYNWRVALSFWAACAFAAAVLVAILWGRSAVEEKGESAAQPPAT